MKLAIDNIECTDATQSRVMIDKATIEEYEEAMRNGAVFPGIVVFAEKGSDRYILADGFHRLRAAKNVGMTEVGVDLREGNLHDAMMYAMGCNYSHGLRRTNADKQHVVRMALKDAEMGGWSNRAIGDTCRVSHTFVRRIREDIAMRNGEDKEVSDATNGNVSTQDIRETQQPSRDDYELRQIKGATSVIKSIPFSGSDAAHDMELAEMLDDLRYARDWLQEAIEYLEENEQ